MDALMQVMDAQCLVGVADMAHKLGLTPFMRIVSTLGNSGQIWALLAAVLFCFKKTRFLGIAIALALIIDGCLGYLIKNFIARPRPCSVWLPDYLSHCPKSFSFPSGHTSAAFTTLGVFLGMRARMSWLILLGATVMGLSRMALFVHYPTDVLGGIILGLACGFMSVAIIQWLRPETLESTTSAPR